MNFEEYAQTRFRDYEEFASIVRVILEKAVDQDSSVRQPQAFQSRAKSPKRLRDRLLEIGKLDTNELEKIRKDLAGARVIFYTEADVQRFLSSRIIFANFVIEREATKIHTPTEENDNALYRAIHYVIRLKEDRLALPEYSKFKDLKCEIQIQTILDHAWSETSHDIIYKDEVRDGFGARAKEGIRRRFKEIMEKYLRPAGYEIQIAQQEYERLKQGQDLFDRDIVSSLKNADDNNKRYEVLSAIRDYALPHFDNIEPAFAELLTTLTMVAKSSRLTTQLNIDTSLGNMRGFEYTTVVRIILEIIERLRYVDPPKTLQALCEIYVGESDQHLRKKITEITKHLAEYNISLFQRAGYAVQGTLLEYLETVAPDKNREIWPLLISVFQEALETDITGAESNEDSVTFEFGSLPASSILEKVRSTAIAGLFRFFLAADNDDEQRMVLGALDAASRLPIQSSYSNELLALSINDTIGIVEFLTEHSDQMSFAILEHVEHQLLWDYRRTVDIASDKEGRFGCEEIAKKLLTVIERFRDKINASAEFGRYKILVGYESIFPGHWTDLDFDITKMHEFRVKEAQSLLELIDEKSEQNWLDFLDVCASTKSDDGATFPMLAQFITSVAKQKPNIAKYLIDHASTELMNFLPAFLNGLEQSDSLQIYSEILAGALQSGQLTAVAMHLRSSVSFKTETTTELLKLAIDQESVRAVQEFVAAIVDQKDKLTTEELKQYFREAVTFLNTKPSSYALATAWYSTKADEFIAALGDFEQHLLLDNMLFLSEVDFRTERILSAVAKSEPEAVWDFFGKRIDRSKKKEGDSRYDAFPFSFHQLPEVLANDPKLALIKAVKWYAEDKTLFQYYGGSLVSRIFANCPPAFVEVALSIVDSGEQDLANVVVSILRNFRGEAQSHPILRRIISLHAENEGMMDQVAACLDNTGVVSGEYGFVEAYRQKKELIRPWLDDESEAVRKFAEDHIHSLDLQIAQEQKMADDRRELRKRRFDKSGKDQSN